MVFRLLLPLLFPHTFLFELDRVSPEMDALADRWAAIEARLAVLEARASPTAAADATPPSVALPPSEADASPTQLRLAAELTARGVTTHAFRRVAACYYDQPLEWRRAALGAPTVSHLAKSLLLANTAHRPPPPDARLTPAQAAALAPYVLVIVQYAEKKLDAEKLRRHLIAAADGAAPSKAFNMRLAPVDVSDRVTGYTHNAVTPVGLALSVPIVLSDEIARLDPPCFWMGGGEVDLKLAVDTAQFVAAYQPMVLDITRGGGGEEN